MVSSECQLSNGPWAEFQIPVYIWHSDGSLRNNLQHLQSACRIVSYSKLQKFVTKRAIGDVRNILNFQNELLGGGLNKLWHFTQQLIKRHIFQLNKL